MNDDEKQGGGISLTRSIFNHTPNIRNQRRLITGFNGTPDEKVDFGEFVHSWGRKGGGRKWQPMSRPYPLLGEERGRVTELGLFYLNL